MPEEITAEQLEMLLQMAVIQQPPYLLAGVGFGIAVLCGLTFGRQVQNWMDGKRTGFRYCLLVPLRSRSVIQAR